MRKFSLVFFMLFLGVLIIPNGLLGQMINAFDAAPADTNYWMWFENHGGQHYQTNTTADSTHGWFVVNYVNDPVYEGAGAMKLDYSVHNTEGWGGYTKLEHWHPDTNSVYDWSGYDSVAFWYNNLVPQSLPTRVTFRFCLHDVSDSPNGNAVYNGTECEYYYSFESILDSLPGWHKWQIALVNDPNAWSGEAFNFTGWVGIPGNGVLDKDKIKGFSFEFSISGAGEGDFSTGTIVFDALMLTGRTHRDWVFFNGKDFPSALSTWSWGQSTIEVEQGAGPIAGTNAVKWVQGNEWGNGWTGIGASISPAYNMAFEWPTDTLKFKMKAEDGVGALRVQIEDGAAKVGKVFTPTADNQWHDYQFKLSELEYMDNTSNFNPENVVAIGMMAEASGIAGKVIYITDWWTGSPVLDVVAPAAPANVTGIPAQYYNLVTWEDVPGESGEVYNVYASEKPITDLESPDVEVIALGVIEGEQNKAHFIYYPLKDQTVQYYYAVTCKDASGNVGPMATSAAVSNAAKGIPTIALNPPANFAADGDISEWDATDIMPFVLKPSVSHWSLGTFTDDNDLNATCYVAVDNDNLYFAADVIDNIYSYDPTGNFWEDDVIEFYIGLYNTIKTHDGFKRGAEPDYKFIILSTEVIRDPDFLTMYTNDSPNYEFVDFGASDWAIEMKIPFDSLLVGGAADDKRFIPQNGMKITMDINIHDSDEPNLREGTLSFSEITFDNSWQGPQNWGYTWIGDTTHVATGIAGDNRLILQSYRLEQNYPNPFNPTTQIRYTIPRSGNVTIRIFNMVGKQVAELVNDYQAMGSYNVVWNAENLPSGIYFYQIQSGVFKQTKKMMLVK